MSTEQELAAVAEALGACQLWFGERKKYVRDFFSVAEVDLIARAAIAAVNTVRAEQASAGGREAVACLVSDAYFCGVIFAEPTATETAKESAKAKVSASEAAVLARMQRPVIAVTDAMVERAMDKEDELVRRWPLRPDERFVFMNKPNMRVVLEAALREDGDA